MGLWTRNLLPILLLAVATATGASAASAGETIPPERLLLRPPVGWHMLAGPHEGNVSVTRIVPDGDNPATATQIINIERYEGQSPSPKAFVENIVAGNRRNCDGVRVSSIDTHSINNYPTAALSFTCTRSRRTGRSGLMMIIAIRGRDALHVVEFTWMGQAVQPNQPVPVPRSVIAQWNAFARSVTLCDIRDPGDHPCPATGG